MRTVVSAPSDPFAVPEVVQAGISTWTLYQLDQLDEPTPERDRNLDRPEPERPAFAQEQPASKRHGLGL